MADFDLYGVATTTSEIKLISITKGGAGKGPQAGTNMLSKSVTLVAHRRDVIAISFDKDICASVANDKLLIVHRISGGGKMEH